MKNKLSIVFVLIAFIIFYNTDNVMAQTFEEWKKQREQEMQQFKDEREKQLQALAAEFDKYVEERDKEFADYLKQRWTQFQVFKGLDIPEEPKPDVAPVFTEPDRPTPPEVLPTIEPEIRLKPDEVPQPILPRKTKQEPQKFPVHSMDFNFYGFPVIFDFDKEMTEPLAGEVSETAISEYFARMSECNYNHLIDQLTDYSKQMNLNDWGYYLMVEKAAGLIATDDDTSSDLLTWFILLRSGFKVKIAYFENEVYLLMPIINQVYGKNFFRLDNLNYYLMEGELLELYTYDSDFPDAQKVFDLNLYRALSLGENPVEKTFNFNYEGAEAPISVIYNANVIDFYEDYPLGDIKIYFDAVISSTAKESLTLNFVPLLQGKSELEAVNLLLNFVQTAFDYKTDQDQFGYEKFFFAEEAFYYPYCDCEDRSVLFAYLVKSLLGLEVIGLNYPGHMATAVNFSEAVSGDYISYEGEDYVVSDPTYINAPVGLTMPKYAAETATIIAISNNYSLHRKMDDIWQKVIASGGNRAAGSGDIVLDEHGNTLLTGYVTEAFSYANINERGNGNPAVFAMKLEAGQEPAWFKSAKVDGFAYGLTIAPDEAGNTYIAGSFRGEMRIDDRQLSTGEVSDVFVAKLDTEGELLWLEKAYMDSLNQENFLNFVSKFDARGRHISNDLYFETGDYSNYGLHLDVEGNVYFTGAFNKSTGMDIAALSFDEIGEFDVVEAIKAENDRLIKEDCDKTIAGLYAVLSLVQNSGTVIPGSDAQKVLDKYNPGFQKTFEDFYESIGRIRFLKNQEGIVTIKTDNGRDVYFDMLRVKDDAKAKIIFLEDGNAKLEMLSGVKVGKAFVWLNLNSVIMYRHNSDMLFDFASEHCQKVMNLRDDILD